MSDISRIGLGTAQFGSHYGISNQVGRPSEREISSILERGLAAGVGFLDTATAYGEAESIIGRHLPAAHRIRIVTKVRPVAGQSIKASDGQNLLDEIAASLDRLKVTQVYGVLLHHPPDLNKSGWQFLVDALDTAKQSGWTRRIGASVYDSEQLTLVENRFNPELVQLPLNALDRRPIELGVLKRLKADGIEIHARSVFLQGLLLMKPDAMSEFFAAARNAVAGLHRRWEEHGLDALAGCLAFVLQQPDVDAAIIGVNRCSELDEIIAAVRSLSKSAIEMGPTPKIDSIVLDPSRWPVSVS
jgi:aryl-alcohol dehydrogenase-like predicted oxidoreductase